MSLHDTWIAVRGCSKEQLRDALDLEETTEPRKERRSAPYFSYGTLPSGWAALWIEVDSWAGWDRLIDASRLGFAIALRLNDQVADEISVLAGARDGAILWEISAIGDQLTIVGDTPAELEPIRSRLAAEQTEEDDEWAFHRLAPELAEALCGVALDDEHPDFTYLRPKAGSHWLAAAPKPQLPFGEREREQIEPRQPRSRLGAIVARSFMILLILLMIIVLAGRLTTPGGN